MHLSFGICFRDSCIIYKNLPDAEHWPHLTEFFRSLTHGTVSLYQSTILQMSVPVIPLDEIVEGRCLGEGSQGRVCAGSYLETPVATKQLKDVGEMEMSLHIGKLTYVVPLLTKKLGKMATGPLKLVLNQPPALDAVSWIRLRIKSWHSHRERFCLQWQEASNL